MEREFDLFSIEKHIQQAKEARAKHIGETCTPAFRIIGGYALIAVLVPWQLIRHTLTTMGS